MWDMILKYLKKKDEGKKGETREEEGEGRVAFKDTDPRQDQSTLLQMGIPMLHPKSCTLLPLSERNGCRMKHCLCTCVYTPVLPQPVI